LVTVGRVLSWGPFRRSFWRSPLRGPWLTAILGCVLLVGITVVFVTGLLSYAAYDPRLPGNDKTPGKGVLGFYLFTWPTHPAWLYQVTQGVHVVLGLALIPVLLAKLWSVIPKLFENPPVRSVAHLAERGSLLLLVGGAIFEFVTGVLDVQYWYVFPGSFYTLHFYGAWVFIAALTVHVALRFRRMLNGLRSRSVRSVLATDAAHTVPDLPDPDGLVSPAPAPATMSRRGLLGLVGAGSLVLVGTTAGQSIGGGLRRTALLAPRSRDPGIGPNGFQINKTAAERHVSAAMTGADWRLQLRGGSRVVELSRDELLAMPQHTARLAIACVEGWSSGDQTWSGVRLRDLARAVDVPAIAYAVVESLQTGGAFGTAALARNQVLDGDSLLALCVNGASLSLDHGYPARVIVPDAPGVHNTKWVARMTFHL
jgi:DMSO/TMAO reductase YedYZ molybdopterin-dependent catalytic subunit